MARVPLTVCLILVVALSTTYKAQGTFSVPNYLKDFPKLGKDFEGFAYKGMSDFMGDLESKCPQTPEFKDFFTILKDYMAIFSMTSPGALEIQYEMSRKSEKLYRAMSKLDGTKQGGGSEDSWKLIDGLLSMGKGLVEMERSGLKEITFEQRKELIGSMVKWTRAIGLFVKTASEKKGRSIDLSVYGIDYDTHASSSKRIMYETQGTFSLPLYMKNFPKMGKDFESFAYEGMSEFVSSLESKCPATPEFKDFFVKLEDYMACYKSLSTEDSKDILFKMSGKSEKFFRAMTLLDGTKAGTSVDSWRLYDGLLSMGKVLVEMKKHGSEDITFEQRKELFGSMIKWARAVGLFVKTASEKKGKSIDLSSFGIDYDTNSPSGGGNGKGHFETGPVRINNREL